MDVEKGLPIKQGVHVIKTFKKVKKATKQVDGDASQPEEFIDDDDYNIENINKEKKVLAKRENESRLEKEKEKKALLDLVHSRSMQQCKIDISEICLSATTDPEKSLTKSKKHIFDDEVKHLNDLFFYFSHPDYEVVELAVLSMLIVFKDIIPGYRIRTNSPEEEGVTLKMSTKSIVEYEKSLLKSYRLYLTNLDAFAKKGLNKGTKMIVSDFNSNNIQTKLGISALRCECELLRSVYHFNFRSILLQSIVSHATIAINQVNSICCDSLEYVFKKDTSAELSYEAVVMISKMMREKKDIPESFLRILEQVKVSVPADQFKSIRQKVKQERRKRKKDEDDVSAVILEASAVVDKSSYKKFQVDCLEEMLLVYFRVIRAKVGFALIPAALDGLSRITHLMNVDTAVDLISLMRDMLELNPAPPLPIRLHCVMCALRTLSGPGQELNIDEGVFVLNLRNIIQELPCHFENWDLILESVELCFIKKREARNSIVISFVKLLFISAAYVVSINIGRTILSMAHAILLRYPRARSSIYALAIRYVQEEEVVGDLAMIPLKQEYSSMSSSFTDVNDDIIDGDGSWVLILLRHHIDMNIRKIIDTVMSKNVIPLPVRLSEAKNNFPQQRYAEIAYDAIDKLPNFLRNDKQKKVILPSDFIKSLVKNTIDKGEGHNLKSLFI